MGGDARTAGEAVSEAVIKAAIESIVSGAVDGDIAFVKGDNEGSVAVALESKIFQSTDILFIVSYLNYIKYHKSDLEEEIMKKSKVRYQT